MVVQLSGLTHGHKPIPAPWNRRRRLRCPGSAAKAFPWPGEVVPWILVLESQMFVDFGENRFRKKILESVWDVNGVFFMFFFCVNISGKKKLESSQGPME